MKKILSWQINRIKTIILKRITHKKGGLIKSVTVQVTITYKNGIVVSLKKETCSTVEEIRLLENIDLKACIREFNTLLRANDRLTPNVCGLSAYVPYETYGNGAFSIKNDTTKAWYEHHTSLRALMTLNHIAQNGHQAFILQMGGYFKLIL